MFVITLRELAQMQSGLVTFDAVEEFANSYIADPYQSFTPAQLLGNALDKPLQFPPRTRYDYSNANIVLLALVVEKQSGQPTSSPPITFAVDRPRTHHRLK